LKENQNILTSAKLVSTKKKIYCIKPSNVFLIQVSIYKFTALPEHKTKQKKPTVKSYQFIFLSLVSPVQTNHDM